MIEDVDSNEADGAAFGFSIPAFRELNSRISICNKIITTGIV